MRVGRARCAARRAALDADTWRRVAEDWRGLGRLARMFCRHDGRLDVEDFRSRLAIDLVEARRLYDPARGAWSSWVYSRGWLTRLRMIRDANRHEGRDRQRIDPAGSRLDGTDPDRGLDVAAGVGDRGSPARTEALADLQRLYDRSTPGERDAILVRLHGLSPATTGAPRREVSTRMGQVRDRAAVDAPAR